MKKQSGPFKLKYKKSAFPFMENFHVRKHGKLKIERKKSTRDVIYDIKNPIETEREKTKIKKTVTSDLDKILKSSGNGAKRGKIGPPPSPKQPEKLPEFTKKPFDSGISIYGDKKVKPKKFSDKLKSFSDKVSKISDKTSKGGGFKDSPFNPYRRKGFRRFFK